MFENKHNILFFLAFILLISFIIFYPVFTKSDKPVVVVDRLEETPLQYILYEEHNPALVGVLPKKKLETTYKYVYMSVEPVFGENNPDKNKYLSKHPEDAMIRTYFGDQKYEFLIFSNDPNPDPEFFEVAND